MKQTAPINLQHQKEQLLEIGHVLRQARQARGLSLDEVAQNTLIRQRLLAAIEVAEMAELPEPIYIRGLIRRYAEALGLDGETLSSQFFTRPIISVGGSAWKNSAAAQLRPLHLYSIYLLLIIASVTGLSYLLKLNAPETTAQPILDRAEIEQLRPRQDLSAQPASAPAAPEEAPAKPKSPVEVSVQFTQQSWVRIVADGKVEFEGILQQGDTRDWSAQQSVTIRAGNAGGVMVKHNQSEAKTMGKPGMVSEQTFLQGEAISMGL
ncbi:MAG: RodZ domain-containing protein [Cyanobacteria bacterium P01_D01_bin.44]